MIDYAVFATLYGLNGEKLPSDQIVAQSPSSLRIGASSTISEVYNLTDPNLGNPWAERVALRISFSGNKAVSAETQVSHGAPIARVYEFTVSPSQVRLGDLLTVKWNVGGATRLRLSRWIADPTSISGPTAVDVEPEGSRTVVLRSADAMAVTLFVDDWGPLITYVRPLPALLSETLFLNMGCQIGCQMAIKPFGPFETVKNF